MKEYASNVESERLFAEEEVRTNGQPINPKQIWRDGALIPDSPKKCTFTDETVEQSKLGPYTTYLHTFRDGAKINNLVQKVVMLPLERVKGTSNVFISSVLKNCITRQFDADNGSAEDSWQFILYSKDKVQLAYAMGNPLLDVAAGTITFRDKDFVSTLTPEDIFYISFYKYVGRTGFLGSHNETSLDDYSGIDLPFRDDILHFKSATNDNTTAQFVLHGTEGEKTVYILPSNKDVYHGPVEGAGVIMLEENYNTIDWHIGVHDGGKYVNGEVKRVAN